MATQGVEDSAIKELEEELTELANAQFESDAALSPGFNDPDEFSCYAVSDLMPSRDRAHNKWRNSFAFDAAIRLGGGRDKTQTGSDQSDGRNRNERDSQPTLLALSVHDASFPSSCSGLA